MPKLIALCKKYGIPEQIDICRRWLTNSDLDMETVVQDVAKITKMKFKEDKPGTIETVKSGDVTGSGEEHDQDLDFVDLTREHDTGFVSKKTDTDAKESFLKQVGKA